MVMTELSVGCTWDRRLLDMIAELNEQHAKSGIQVTELYGSLKSHDTGVPSARPDFRLPQIDINEFRKYVLQARSLDIDVNYTCNATMHCSVEELFSKRQLFADFFKFLEDAGVARLTIANPLLIEIANASCKLPLDISTILHPNIIAQIPIYASWRADRVCLDIYRNRDISFLRDYNQTATTHGVAPVLIVNEFCMFGGAPCLGLLRQACYEHSSMGGNEFQRFANWPFSRCHTARMNSLYSWLQARFILPQHLATYTRLTGIRHFKITGRTFTTAHVLRLVSYYLSKEFDGPLPLLWVDPGNKETEDIAKAFNITPKDLESVRFFARWFDDLQPCDYSCGVTCTYCRDKYEEIALKRQEAR